MKKFAVIAMLCMAFPVIILGLCCTGLSSGDIGSVSSPLAVFASEEKAYEYQYVGTELGIPWDMVMLADGIYAYASGDGNIEDYNPLHTALQFCILLEEEMVPAPDADVSGGDGEREWITQKTRYYAGQMEILAYIGTYIENMDYRDVNSMVTAINDAAEGMSTDDKRYRVTLIANPDYEDVLRNYVGLDEKNTKWVFELYESNYLAKMYGVDYDYTDIVLPDIVQGDVTRQQLAEMAVSLLGHPYLMGGKSSQTGPPTGPLDCSGYVDWVYIQCFGVGAANGSTFIPEGVAVSGTAQQWYASEQIKEEELKVGDLGFLRNPATMSSGQVNHVGIYIGSYNGKTYWIHCGGKVYGTEALPNGRVGISTKTGMNSYNPVLGNTFEPAMNSCNFRYFRRPRFAFAGE